MRLALVAYQLLKVLVYHPQVLGRCLFEVVRPLLLLGFQYCSAIILGCFSSFLVTGVVRDHSLSHGIAT